VSVEVHQLSKTYKQLKAVDQISFTAESGKILGFLGPNGAGKSTTMKILSCFIPPSTGSARICGFDILDHPIEVRSHIGYLPEHNPLYLDLYVQESLHFIASIHQIANREQRIADVIEQVGLGSEQRKKIADLSKGYRQRVGLAQAILHNPQVLILDEPTSGLDPNQIIGIRSLIKELGKTKTIILSTHIMQEVEAVCDQIIIINKGQIVENQTIQSLKQTYKGKTLEEIFILKTNY
jgi:ABC-2 type transport system ATP-binding protein